MNGEHCREARERIGAARLSEVAKILGVAPGYFSADTPPDDSGSVGTFRLYRATTASRILRLLPGLVSTSAGSREATLPSRPLSRERRAALFRLATIFRSPRAEATQGSCCSPQGADVAIVSNLAIAHYRDGP
jgi:hypothetical protein